MVNHKIDEPEPSLHSLNPDHTHFILVDDDNMHIKLLKFRVALEKRLQKPIFNNRKAKRSTVHLESLVADSLVNEEPSKDNISVSNPQDSYNKIPIVALLIGIYLHKKSTRKNIYIFMKSIYFLSKEFT